ncbi:hypothetical protein HYDPIDRAFT_26959 [Hydnomerulius pinastri MD-312]|nr:hypothetical protein HYDPIDRAFT_26959 [Hydnomerulius pinastri MD-312]
MNRLLPFTLTRGYAPLDVLCKLIRIAISIVSRWHLSTRNVFWYLHRWLTVKLARDNGYDNIACSSSQTTLDQALAGGRITPALEVAPVGAAENLVVLPVTDNVTSSGTLMDEDDERDKDNDEDPPQQRHHNRVAPRCKPKLAQQNGAGTPLQTRHVAIAPPKGRDTVPIIPDVVGRYDRACRLRKSKNTKLHLPCMPGNFCFAKNPPQGWTACIHPEGALYYYNSQMRVFTDADLTDKKIANDINLCAKKLYGQAKEKQMWSEDAELTLEIMEDGGKDVCGYYFARHSCRQLFWLEDIDIRKSDLIYPMVHKVKVITKPSQLKYAMESQYWWHCALFPNHRRLPGSVLREVKQIIVHFNGEMLLSEASLSPFDIDQLGVFLTLMDAMKDSIDQTDAHTITIIGGMMRMFCRSKHINLCGQPEARLNADQSLIKRSKSKEEDSLKKRVWAYLRFFLVLLLWNSPNAHFRALKRIWVDSVIIEPRWKNFTAQLNKEWNQITVLSTVILAVNISFLAVPGVLSANSPPGAQAISTYVSTLCIVGSLVVSVVLSGQVNDKERESAQDAAEFMERFDLDILAIFHSLPFALLTWGILFFAISLSIMIFESQSTIARYVVYVGYPIIALFTLWPVLASIMPRFHIPFPPEWLKKFTPKPECKPHRKPPKCRSSASSSSQSLTSHNGGSSNV